MSLREGVMPHMFAVWSVAFYRAFSVIVMPDVETFPQRSPVASSVFWYPGIWVVFNFLKCVQYENPHHTYVSSLVRIQGIIDRLNMQIKYIFLLISVVFIVS